MNIICIIPARGDSKGIPQKNVIKFCGKPLITWSIEQAKSARFVRDIYVSSDSKDILKISKKAGAGTIKRPKRLAADTSPAEEALFHGLDYIQKLNNKKIDMVVFLQATSPVRTSGDIDNAIKLFISKKADSLFSACILEDFCIWRYQNKRPNSLNFDYKKRKRRQDKDPLYLENGSIYIFKPGILRESNNRLGGKIVIYTMSYQRSFEIDNPDDIEMCEYYMKKEILKQEV